MVDRTAGSTEETGGCQKKIEETVVARSGQPSVLVKVALRGWWCGTQRPNCSRIGKPELGELVLTGDELEAAETGSRPERWYLDRVS